MKPELIIFDMDGVLVDSEATFKRACADALHNFGVFPEHEEFTPYTGMGDPIYIGEVAKSHGVPYQPEMVSAAYELYAKYAVETLDIFPWSRTVLKTLHKHGIPICIASSAGLPKVKVNLECVGVDLGIFETIVSGDEVERRKPYPDIFLKAAEKCKTDPSKCLVFEDAKSGVAAAKAAGMTVATVTTSFPGNELSEVGSNYVCDDLREAVTEFCDIKEFEE